MKIRVAALVILCVWFSSACWADDVSIVVVFANGDRLSGTLEELNGTELRIRPQAVHSLGTAITFNWEQDSMAELRAGAGCLYPKGSASVCFQNAVVRRAADKTLSVTREDGQILSGVIELSPTAIVSETTNKETPGAAVALTAAAPQNPQSGLISMWSVGLNAPESAVNATQSSQNLGGSLFSNLYFGDPNHLIISAAGTHQHNYSAGKSIKTDIFDSYVQFGHTFGSKPSTNYTLYEIGQWFFNTSLGVAALRSGGAGVVFPTWRSESKNFSFKVSADLRYFNERLYKVPASLDLVGSRFRSQAIYSPSDRKWSITAVAWINPMWNNEGAWLGSANLTVSVPFGKHVCLDFTPADDTYVENAPKGNRKNYLSSTATLKIIAGPNPGQVCSQ
jgi:hypothetical protein